MKKLITIYYLFIFAFLCFKVLDTVYKNSITVSSAQNVSGLMAQKSSLLNIKTELEHQISHQSSLSVISQNLPADYLKISSPMVVVDVQRVAAKQ